jgi:hypothetical protein
MLRIVFVLVCSLPAAPAEPKPLFSAEYLADRELNRTGQTPSDLQAALSADKRKKHKADTYSCHGASKAQPGADAAPSGVPQSLQQHSQIELNRSSDPSTVSSGEHAVVGRVIIDQQQQQGSTLVLVKQQGHDVEAGHVLPRSDSGRGLALPFTPMSVAFQDVSYFVPHPGVSGACDGDGASW